MTLELAPEQKRQDINERCTKAMDEIRPILDKYQLEFAARLQPTDAAIVAIPVLKDTRYETVKSPLQIL